MFLGGAGILVFFGFIVLILSSRAGHESLADRAFEGDFDAAKTESRWTNLEEVSGAQEALVDSTKVDAAYAALAKSAPAAGKTELIVPGSPTFLKQLEASQPAPVVEPKADVSGAEVKAESPAAEPKGAPAPPASDAGQKNAPKVDMPAQKKPAKDKGVKPEAKAPVKEKPKASTKGDA
tara:strand:- start:321 stop:857 length:537 start_codon:yes stop_codon:yes gene_type:complete